MSNLPISLEARAQMIADFSTATRYAGKPSERREAVAKAALEHLRAVYREPEEPAYNYE